MGVTAATVPYLRSSRSARKPVPVEHWHCRTGRPGTDECLCVCEIRLATTAPTCMYNKLGGWSYGLPDGTDPRAAICDAGNHDACSAGRQLLNRVHHSYS